MLGGMRDMIEVEEMLGTNLGEMLRLRQFELKCNKKLPNPKKIQKFWDETERIGGFYFYKRGDLFK